MPVLETFLIRFGHIIIIPAKRPEQILINLKKRICHLVDFTVVANHKVKMKEIKKINKYFDLAIELKKLVKVKVTVMPKFIDVLRSEYRGFFFCKEKKNLRKWKLETIALLRLARFLRSFHNVQGDLLSLRYQWKDTSERTPPNADVKNLLDVKLL